MLDLDVNIDLSFADLKVMKAGEQKPIVLSFIKDNLLPLAPEFKLLIQPGVTGALVLWSAWRGFAEVGAARWWGTPRHLELNMLRLWGKSNCLWAIPSRRGNFNGPQEAIL